MSAPNHAKVKILKEETYYQLEPPSWWTKTKVRYKLPNKESTQTKNKPVPAQVGSTRNTQKYANDTISKPVLISKRQKNPRDTHKTRKPLFPTGNKK